MGNLQYRGKPRAAASGSAARDAASASGSSSSSQLSLGTAGKAVLGVFEVGLNAAGNLVGTAALSQNVVAVGKPGLSQNDGENNFPTYSTALPTETVTVPAGNTIVLKINGNENAQTNHVRTYFVDSADLDGPQTRLDGSYTAAKNVDYSIDFDPMRRNVFYKSPSDGPMGWWLDDADEQQTGTAAQCLNDLGAARRIRVHILKLRPEDLRTAAALSFRRVTP